MDVVTLSNSSDLQIRGSNMWSMGLMRRTAMSSAIRASSQRTWLLHGGLRRCVKLEKKKETTITEAKKNLMRKKKLVGMTDTDVVSGKNKTNLEAFLISRPKLSPRLSLSLVSSASSSDDISELFDDWCQRHGKTYGSEEERQHRLQIFKDNHDFITQHNRTNSTYSLGLNAFSDLTHDEFKTSRLGLLSKDFNG